VGGEGGGIGSGKVRAERSPGLSKQVELGLRMSKEAVDDLWASFNAPEPSKPSPTATAPTTTVAPLATTSTRASTAPMSTPATAPKPKVELVKIKFSYNFVGEMIE